MFSKKILEVVKKFFRCKKCRFGYLNKIGFYRNLSDEKFLKKSFKVYMGYDLKLSAPKTFNEKLQWLKLYDRQDRYTIFADKIAVKKYVASIIGEQYIIPTLGEWDEPEQINFDKLPNQFVLKCNHNSGLGMCICKNKNKLDTLEVKNELKKGLKENYYLPNREWCYKNIHHRIIAEKYMSDSDKDELTDYKLMCFNGKVKCTLVCENRHGKDGLKITFYDRQWQVMPVERISHPRNDKIIEKPANYEKMVELAEQLASGIPFLRVDFYEVQDKIYFGELTFYPASGFEGFNPPEWDRILGDWLVLPEKKK